MQRRHDETTNQVTVQTTDEAAVQTTDDAIVKTHLSPPIKGIIHDADQITDETIDKTANVRRCYGSARRRWVRAVAVGR